MPTEREILCPGSREYWFNIVDDHFIDESIEGIIFTTQKSEVDIVISIQATKDTPVIELLPLPSISDPFPSNDLH